MLTDEYAGEIICSGCGVVLEEKIQSEAKPREKDGYSNGDTSSNFGSSICLSSHHSLMSTSIGNSLSFSIVDHNGKMIPSHTKNSFSRLYRVGEIQRSKASDTQKRIIPGITKLKGYTSKLNLPNSMFEDSITLYKKAHAAKIIRGCSTRGLAAVCLYHTCKASNISKTMAEISETSGIPRKKLFRYYTTLTDSLELGYDCVLEKNNSENKNSLHHRYTVQIPVISSRLDLSQKIIRKSVEFLNETAIEIISGKKPANVAAASIYIVCNMQGHTITQRELAQAAGLTDVGIRNMIKVLRNK